jgi:hypothetical protein
VIKQLLLQLNYILLQKSICYFEDREPNALASGLHKHFDDRLLAI